MTVAATLAMAVVTTLPATPTAGAEPPVGAAAAAPPDGPAAAWLVGLLLAFRLNTIQSGTGNGLEFEYIIAAVVGGTLLTGGYGSAFKEFYLSKG